MAIESVPVGSALPTKTKTVVGGKVLAQLIAKGELILRKETWFDAYRGPANALIAAGLVELSHIPGQSTSGKTMATIDPDGNRVLRGHIGYSGSNEGWKRIIKVGNKFELHVYVAPDECERRRNESRAAAEQEKTARISVEDRAVRLQLAQRNLREIPKSDIDFLKSLAFSVRLSLNSKVDYHLVTRRGYGGYKLSEESVASILISVDAIIEAIMQCEPLLDASLQRECIQRHKAEIASLDPQFQSALANLVLGKSESTQGGK